MKQDCCKLHMPEKLSTITEAPYYITDTENQAAYHASAVLPTRPAFWDSARISGLSPKNQKIPFVSEKASRLSMKMQRWYFSKVWNTTAPRDTCPIYYTSISRCLLFFHWKLFRVIIFMDRYGTVGAKLQVADLCLDRHLNRFCLQMFLISLPQ